MSAPPSDNRQVVDATMFRHAMSMLAAPVTIVTTRDEGGRPWGLTASSVTSVSLSPPLLLVAIARGASCHAGFMAADEFVVNVLDVRHRELALRFAVSGADRFGGGGVGHWPGTRLPCLIDANALFQCRKWRVIAAGDHDLMLGELVDLRTNDVGQPLMWYRRGFMGLRDVRLFD